MQPGHEMALIIFWKCIISRLSCFNKSAWFAYLKERSLIWKILLRLNMFGAAVPYVKRLNPSPLMHVDHINSMYECIPRKWGWSMNDSLEPAIYKGESNEALIYEFFSIFHCLLHRSAWFFYIITVRGPFEVSVWVLNTPTTLGKLLIRC